MTITNKHYQVSFSEACAPEGITTRAFRVCLCCRKGLTSHGGGGDYICHSCLSTLRQGTLQNEFLTGKQNTNLQKWISTKNNLPVLPENSSEDYIDCWIYINGRVVERPWNVHFKCWDDISRDDFEFKATEPSHWMFKPNSIPKAPG